MALEAKLARVMTAENHLKKLSDPSENMDTLSGNPGGSTEAIVANIKTILAGGSDTTFLGRVRETANKVEHFLTGTPGPEGLLKDPNWHPELYGKVEVVYLETDAPSAANVESLTPGMTEALAEFSEAQDRLAQESPVRRSA